MNNALSPLSCLTCSNFNYWSGQSRGLVMWAGPGTKQEGLLTPTRRKRQQVHTHVWISKSRELLFDLFLTTQRYGVTDRPLYCVSGTEYLSALFQLLKVPAQKTQLAATLSIFWCAICQSQKFSFPFQRHWYNFSWIESVLYLEFRQRWQKCNSICKGRGNPRLSFSVKSEVCTCSEHWCKNRWAGF